MPPVLGAQDLAVLRGVQERTRAVLREAVGQEPGQPVALLDYPRQDNAGDSLIWQGEVAYLRDLGLPIAHVTDIGRFDAAALERRLPEGALLLQGGGNLGDLWPHYQDFREHVLARYPDRRVVVLSQSVMFRSAERAERARRAFGEHPDLVVLVREQASLRRARELFPETDVRYCPDMALGVGPRERPVPAEVDVVALVRADGESTGSLQEMARGRAQVVTDWHLRGADRLRWAAASAPGALYRRVPDPLRRTLQPALDRSFPVMARLNVEAAAAALARGRVVVTDRLHAHVLCALMGIPHVVLDNSYGKVSAVVEDCTGRLSSVHLARTADEAATRLDDLLESARTAAA